jgi:hypothetical protein
MWKRRAWMASWAGVISALVGPLLAGTVLAVLTVLNDPSTVLANPLAPLALLGFYGFWSLLVAGPFGLVVGLLCGWWISIGYERGIRGLRLAGEAGLAGVLLGACFPLFPNLLEFDVWRAPGLTGVFVLSAIGAGVGLACGLMLAWLWGRLVSGLTSDLRGT